MNSIFNEIKLEIEGLQQHSIHYITLSFKTKNYTTFSTANFSTKKIEIGYFFALLISLVSTYLH